MSVAANVMSKVLIREISDGVDVKLRKDQVGFKQGRSKIEQISSLGTSWINQSNRIPACTYELSTT